MEANNPGAAARAYSKAHDQRPDDATIALKLAQARLAADLPAEALPLAEQAHQSGAEGAEAVYIEVLVRTLRVEQALDLLGDDPAPELLPLAAEAWIAMGDLEKASDALSRAEPTPTNKAAHAYVEARLGRREALDALTPEVVDWFDVSADAWGDVGAAHLALGHLDDGFAAGAQALANEPVLLQGGGAQENWRFHAGKAEEASRTETAMRLTYRAASMNPEDAQLAWDLGRRLVHGGELSLGALWLEKALVTPPFNDPETTSGVATVGTQGLGRTDRDQIRRQIALKLAETYVTLKRPEDEVRAAQVVVESEEPPTADSLMRLSYACTRAGQHLASADAAQAAYQAQHPAAAQQAARAYAAQGNLTTAIGWANTALDEDPTNADLALLLAQLYAADRRYQAAIEVLDSAQEANPNDVRLNQAQQRIYSAAL